MEIKTDHKYRPMKCLRELSKKVAKDFKYVDYEFHIRFVKYQGE